MSIIDIWKRRVTEHQKKMMKYLKYVLNDHFVIVCLFLLGALGYAYSEMLKSVSTDFAYGKVLAWIVFSSLIFIGNLATLIQPADSVFLLQKEAEMEGYFKKAKSYSLILPLIVIGFISAAVMPLLVATSSFAFSDWIVFFASMVLIKEVELDAQIVKIKQVEKKERNLTTLIVGILSIVSSFLGLYVHPFVGLAGALMSSVLWHARINHWLRVSRYQWEFLVQKESTRLKNIYQFINLFTDIPALKGTVKRRAYLDNIMGRMELKQDNTYLYLFSKALLRGTEYSGLVIRLSLIGLGVVALITYPILVIVMSLLFLYLTGFQLIPLYYHYDDHLLSVLYPVEKKQKLKAMQKILFTLLVAQSGLFFIATSLTMPFLTSLSVFGLNSLFSILFSQVYFPARIKKLSNNERNLV